MYMTILWYINNRRHSSLNCLFPVQYYRRELDVLLAVREAKMEMFTCPLYPGMEPTDNLVEQTIRELTPIRKIIETFRSQNG